MVIEINKVRQYKREHAQATGSIYAGDPMNIGGIVLCGGKSSRMGLPKATLPFGSEVMLQRVVRLLGEAVDPIVVVAAVAQELPELCDDVIVTRDDREGRGPLQGMHAGLSVLEDRAEAVFATSCDVPLLLPSFVRRLIDELGGHDVAVPVEDGFHHPLASVYRVSVLPLIAKLLAEDQLRPRALYDLVDTKRVQIESLRKVDPTLGSLRNLNRSSDYLEALAIAGFDAPQELLGELSAD